MAEAIKLPGLSPIPLVSPDEAELADFVVCSRKGSPSPFTDNLEAECALCGAAIIHRPYMPRRPMKMCLDCFLAKELGPKQ